ncbi:flavin reductase family protein [Beijerinckia indica]|uniref:Flavin reductase domain protein FMN-binding n=1 Tax=Beijerinckia indica subsp. indica (strain ATCC 9039 / DSM 1715 / NCIMB 8712) TaxID=395963 RepID=B2IIZ6_BEII9|nr:flavin reductase family protein [Beijerinckia indica]ACB96211.1 flavin reductase domain protein FMN-binding [Beijerinckia indica subsp. indica ATCC 9039]
MSQDTQPTSAIDDFKHAMRRLTATVSLVTTIEGENRYGMVATAVCSLGVAPPSLLISVAHTASLHDPLMRSRRFGVNMLSTEQSFLVGPFSGMVKGKERFAFGEWIRSCHGLPRLLGAQASVFCDVAQTFEHSGHTVVIGTVIETIYQDAIRPLLYENGRFVRSEVLESAPIANR